MLHREDGHRFAVAGLSLFVRADLIIDIACAHEHRSFRHTGLSGLGNGFLVHLQRSGCILLRQIDISHRTVELVQTVLIFGLLGHGAQLADGVLAAHLGDAHARIELHLGRRREAHDGLIGIGGFGLIVLQLIQLP